LRHGGQQETGYIFTDWHANYYQEVRTPVTDYNTAGASYGLQASAQSYGYALFFMNEGALRYLDQSDGWEIGVEPSVVIVDEGMAKSMRAITAA
jgi:lipid-binding SYLF domain-containing protein